MSLGPKWYKANVALIPLTTIVSHAFARSTYPLLLPAIIDDMGLTNSTAGIGGSLLFVSYLAGVILVTVMSSNLAPLSTMKLGQSAASIGLLIEGMGKSIELVFVGLVLAGMGAAAIWLTAPLLATEGVPPQRRGLVVGVVTGAVGLGTSLVALTTNLVRSATTDNNLWRPVFVIESVFALAIWALITLVVRSSMGRSGGRRPLSLDAVRTMPAWAPVTIAYTLFGTISAGFASFLAEALENDGHLSRSTVSTIYVVFGVGAVLGAPLAGWASDRYGRRPIMAVVMGLIANVCLAVAFLEGTPLIVAVALLGGLWPTYPTLTATYVRDHAPEGEFASVFGTMTILFGIAAIIPPLASGRLADLTGSFTIAYLILGALSIVAAAVIAGTDSPPSSTLS